MAAFVEEGEAERVEGEQAGALVGVLAKGDAECTRDEPDESEEEDEDVWVRRDGKVERAVREGVEHAEVGLAGEEKEDGGATTGAVIRRSQRVPWLQTLRPVLAKVAMRKAKPSSGEMPSRRISPAAKRRVVRVSEGERVPKRRMAKGARKRSRV